MHTAVVKLLKFREISVCAYNAKALKMTLCACVCNKMWYKQVEMNSFMPEELRHFAPLGASVFVWTHKIIQSNKVSLRSA